MDEDRKDSRIISELALLALSGELSEEQIQKLNDFIVNEPWARDYYLEFIATQVALENAGCLGQNQPEFEMSESFDSNLWQLLAIDERTAPPVVTEKSKRKDAQPVKMFKVEKRPRRVSRFSLFTLVSAAAVWLCIIMLAKFLPVEIPVVATLGDSIDAVWSEHTGPIEVGSELRPGRMILKEGFAELIFDGGASVLVQSPAEFELENDDMMFLTSGKVFATVSQEAIGFTVRTAQATIVDHGTEFGVAVEEDGVVDTQVFKGKVKLSSANWAEREKGQCWLTGGQAVLVDTEGRLSKPYKVQNERTFLHNLEAVRACNKYLDRNLIQNPGFEKDVASEIVGDRSGSSDWPKHDIAIQGWQDESDATVYTYYSNSGSLPHIGRDPVPVNCGQNYFMGVDDGEIYQDVPVSQLATFIDDGKVSFKLSGWIGGYGNDRDNLTMVASFRDMSGRELSQVSIGDVTPEERNGQIMFLYKETVGEVPTGTDCIRIILVTKRYGGVSDSYADNLELVLTEK